MNCLARIVQIPTNTLFLYARSLSESCLEMIILWVFVLVTPALGFSCRDQTNNSVDWFAVYKMPIESSDTSIPGIGTGVGWYYVDVKEQGSLKASSKTLNDKDQAISYTLQQFYDQKSDANIFHVMYNDEPYEAASRPLMDLLTNRIGWAENWSGVEYGHTKGVVFFDGKSGVWLVHSVPKFPPPDHYEYPESGHDYGQTMFCMTFTYDELSKIGTQLYYNHPHIYSSNLPTHMAAQNPDLAKVIGGDYKKGEPYSSVIDLVTTGGSTFKSFAKTNQFNNDLYDALVAPVLKTDLTVETWRRGDEIPLACRDRYYSLDAQNIKVGNTGEFKYTKDHSKWAHSNDASKPFVCIGDINRMTSQYARGGGTECISSHFLWNAFTLVVNTNMCT